MSATTDRTTTVPATIVEAHTLAGVLLATLAALGFHVGYVVVNHHTYPWGPSASVSLQVDHPEDVAAFLVTGLARMDYDVDGVSRYYYAGTWRGIDLHVAPLAVIEGGAL